ncbi:uncharacterized protein H6S33_002781 [Morchella sextelata]|uniref:uncharacterized protein n=1 Tax=Morchella sextelata TaxID=1174677 RepID=UPI001D05956A|nr:uncharacterized protein H6S33_002781 [Morchella sextelata]KAH0607747.1 hypothetical protein H6S33_002781 [Morchella sextelata]
MTVKLCCTRPFRARTQASTSTQISELRDISTTSPSNPSPAEVPKQTVAFHPTVATSSTEPANLSEQESSISIQRRPSSFTPPSLDMLAGRTPLGAWHAVAAKVVATNRFRGVGGESCVEDFKIEELGGQSGKLVFGPVSVFNGNVSLRIKKPLKGMTLTVTFNGVAEVDKCLLTFLNISHEVYSGDLQEGLRTFLFGFNFPYLNLPPSSKNPNLVYSFIAKLTDAKIGPVGDDSSTRSRILEYKSKPLEIFFIPYIDPSLHSPTSRVDTNPNQSNGKGKGVESVKEGSVDNTLSPEIGSQGPATVAKPKLTLTTADIPISASSNSTPVIDKPRPLDLSITKSCRIIDDDNNTVAKLIVDLPKTKFLPDEEIFLGLRLVVKDGEAIPKGFGVRVIEKRFLARIDSDGDNRDTDSEDEGHQQDMKVIGKKQSKVLAGRKFTLRPEEARTVREAMVDNPDIMAGSDGGLKGGKVIELPIKIRLPTFQTFINDFLLPTATLPLVPSDLALDSGKADSIPLPTYTEKGKGKSPAISPVTTTPTATTSISMESINKNLNFVVAHILQVTVPTNGSGSWFKKSTSVAKDLEVTIPIVLGNINSVATGRRKVPELRLNALEEIRHGSGVGSVRSSVRSSVGSASGAGAPPNKPPPTWREGERFLTLKETDVQPFFSADSYANE